MAPGRARCSHWRNAAAVCGPDNTGCARGTAASGLARGGRVGSAQLHPSLRSDPRVLCVEKVNARSLCTADLERAYEDSTSANGLFEEEDEEGAPAPHLAHADVPRAASESLSEGALESGPEFAPEFDLIVADLSFISQTLVLPAVVPMLKPGGTLLTLVKPQFELQPGQVGKGGIVKDPALYAIVEARLRTACQDLGLTVTAWFDSPIQGGDGNHEYFICATHAPTASRP